MDWRLKGRVSVMTICLGLIFVLVLSCSVMAASIKGLEGREPFSTVPNRESLEIIRANKTNPGFVLIDVRTPEEFESGHIEGAININYHEEAFVDNLNKLDKGKAYLIYCRTGRRSSDTLNIMKSQGFKEVYRILGDIVKWKADGLPTVKP